MLVSILTALQVVLCFALVGLVLLQHGKGADAGAGFGAGASGTVFGAGGSATFLSRTTAILATLFFLNCIALSYLIEQQVKAAPAVLLRAPARVVPAPKAPGRPASAKPGTGAPVAARTTGGSAPASGTTEKGKAGGPGV